ncbi:Nucleic acid-binding, OB-fold protein [Beauveria brongniartii RCEF 3172]|uniref:Nucleic acid-binding, OB-fold protein n=1 Tax=Beauveria brongniartii RCEF 3172 TaxID=1081107 RepID=A0A167IB76_9HYPO|nr:Nucleic acid-binding, OB-fold protein [Beauveria brongniartii RCEF 3172]
MPLRIILLAGAPPPSAVDESKCTVEHFDEPFHAYINAAETHGTSSSSHHHSSPASIAPWRLVTLHRKPLHTGFSQTHSFLARPFYGDHQDGGFFCPSSLTSSSSSSSSSSYGRSEGRRVEQDEAVLSEFCEQSLAIHHSLSSSQLRCDDANTTTTATSFLDETSFLSSLTTPTVGGHQRPPAPNIPPAAHLSDLEDVPSAKHVISLQPQTITLNIIVGILSIAQPRSVTTRWGTTLSLVEVLLGDDTKSGFAVTFWLAREAMMAGGKCVLLGGGLRRQDVVLLQNVALHVFRGKVYGQSLRRGQTKVHLLWSKRMDARACYSSRALNAAGDDAAVENPQIAKTRLVRDWVIRFVGADPEVKGRNKDDVWDLPPDDTQ